MPAGHQVPIERLLNLFDAAIVLDNAWITLFESDVPGAEYAARLWASTKGMHIDVCDDMQVVHIRKSDSAGAPSLISVHRAVQS